MSCSIPQPPSANEKTFILFRATEGGVDWHLQSLRIERVSNCLYDYISNFSSNVQAKFIFPLYLISARSASILVSLLMHPAGTSSCGGSLPDTMAGGLLGALAAAVPGYLDYRTTTVPAIKRIGRWHMLINLSLVVLFAINLWLRMESEPGATLPIILSVIAVVMLGVSGWLGGELVYVHGAAVEPQPNPLRKDLKHIA